MSEPDQGNVAEPAASAEAATPAPHAVSMVVWDLPSPAAVSDSITVSVGLQCAHGCPLGGQPVEIADAAGLTLAHGVLEPTPRDGTDTLYWARLRFTAPETIGVFSFSAGLVPVTEAEAPQHAASRALFSIRTDAPPAHEVRVQVTHEETGEPVARVEVRLGHHYFTYTDENGHATLRVPSGSYECSLRRIGYKADPLDLEVTSDLSLDLCVGKGQTRAELDAWLSSWEDHPWG
jgi:hypothetical protein